MSIHGFVRPTVLLSGGLDSTALCVYYQELGLSPQPVFITYGQQNVDAERRAATVVCSALSLPLRTVIAGALDPTPGYVFGRNAFLVLAALLTSPAPVTGLIGIGIHDGTRYADCSPLFVRRLQTLLDVYASGSVQVDAPFLEMSKPAVAQFLVATRPDLISLTYSCQASSISPCNSCASCHDRESLRARKII